MQEINIDEHLYMKDSIKDHWKKTTATDVLANMELSRQIIPPNLKAIIPAFGFDKREGSRSNQQGFPTHFVVLELDTPPRWKEKIKAGCNRTLQMAQAQTELVYFQLHYSRVPYYWMYMTPSTCGLRFVLQTDRAVINEEHYRQVVLDYLRFLYRFTSGRLNADYHDIRVHQAWYVPVFHDRFSRKEAVCPIAAYRPPPPPEPPKTKPIQQYTSGGTQEELFLKAVKFTERNFTYQEGYRNNYVHHLACNCNRFGIPQRDAEQWLNMQFDLDEKEILSTVASAYRNNQSEFGQFIH
jgi:hypothetical protein